MIWRTGRSVEMNDDCSAVLVVAEGLFLKENLKKISKKEKKLIVKMSIKSFFIIELFKL